MRLFHRRNIFILDDEQFLIVTSSYSRTHVKRIGKTIKNVFRQSDAFYIFEKHAILADGYNTLLYYTCHDYQYCNEFFKHTSDVKMFLFNKFQRAQFIKYYFNNEKNMIHLNVQDKHNKNIGIYKFYKSKGDFTDTNDIRLFDFYYESSF